MRWNREGEEIIKTKNSCPDVPVFRIILTVLLLLAMASCSREEAALKIGDGAPGFSLQDLDGNEISLSDYMGSAVILRFFLTDCKYCRADTPVFNQYYAKYGSQGLKILYLDPLDMNREVLTAFQRELAVPFPIVLDAGGKIARKYNVKAMPQTIILSPRHTILAAILGGVSEEEFDRILAPYIRLTE